MEAVHTENLDGYTIEIYPDTCPESPREWDNLGTMVCFHGKYNLGDAGHGFRQDDYDSWEGLKAAIIKQAGPCVILPLYLYDHSAITISTEPFSCRWDSGQVGYIFVSHETIRKEFSVKRISKKLLQERLEGLKAEVKNFDDYITGEVYGYKIFKGQDDYDSCWGFYGNYSEEGGALYEARQIINNIGDEFKQDIRNAQQQAKAEAVLAQA